MKLLLTSAGISNESIENAFLKLAGKPKDKLTVAFIPTAANVQAGDKWWVIKDIEILHKMKFRGIDIVDFSALPKDIWKPRLEKADVIFVEGGNVSHLIYWINKSGLKSFLPDLLKTKVYIGVSAGSVVMGEKLITTTSERLYSKEIGEYKNDNGLGMVDFSFAVHYKSSSWIKNMKDDMNKKAKLLKTDIYAIDDETAISVIDKKIEIVSEGQWEKFDYCK